MTDTPSIEDKLLALKIAYINSLPEKFYEINQLWQFYKQQTDITDKNLESCLHKLAGSAGMYNETELGELCRALELSISDINPSFDSAFISLFDDEMLKLETMIDKLANQ